MTRRPVDETPAPPANISTECSSDEPSQPIATATSILRAGGLVCIPTETTYGLAADIHSTIGIAKLVSLKGRDPRSPFALIAADVDQARALARVWPPAAERLARLHWPGPLTLVVPAIAGLPAVLVGPGGGVGVRVSSHPVAVALARSLGRPITATSANPSGTPPALDVASARAYFGDDVHYLDDGPAQAQTASTVAAVDPSGRVAVLRAGPIDVSGDLSGTGSGTTRDAVSGDASGRAVSGDVSGDRRGSGDRAV